MMLLMIMVMVMMMFKVIVQQYFVGDLNMNSFISILIIIVTVGNLR